MLRGMIISPDAALREALEALFREQGQVLLLRSFHRYLDQEELDGFLRAHSPQVVFLDISTNPDAVRLATGIARAFPGVFPVAVHRHCDPQLLMGLMHAGIRELLYPPFPHELFSQAMERLAQAVEETPAASESTDLLYAFLPAKDGCGASTVAVNTALAIARTAEKRVLLADCDLCSGMVRFLLKLANPYSVQDALQKSGELDPSLWTEMVTRIGQIDILASGPIQPAWPAEPAALHRLFEFCRRHYHLLCVDLAGHLDHHALRILGEARRIVMVCTPELAAVYLAREKLRFLQSHEMEDRVIVVLNRWSRNSSLSIADIESVLGQPVSQTLPEDLSGISQAMLAGRAVEPSSELGREIARLAQSLSEAAHTGEVTPRKRMVEYFALLPARYTLFPGAK